MAKIVKMLHEFEAIVRIELNNGSPFDAKVTGTYNCGGFDVVEASLEEEYEERRDGTLLSLKIIQHGVDGAKTTRYVDYGNHKKLEGKSNQAAKPSAKLPVKAEPTKTAAEVADYQWFGDCAGVKEIEEHDVQRRQTGCHR